MKFFYQAETDKEVKAVNYNQFENLFFYSTGTKKIDHSVQAELRRPKSLRTKIVNKHSNIISNKNEIYAIDTSCGIDRVLVPQASKVESRYCSEDITKISLINEQYLYSIDKNKNIIIYDLFNKMKAIFNATGVIDAVHSDEFLYCLTHDDDLRIYQMDLSKGHFTYIKRSPLFTKLDKEKQIPNVQLYMSKDTFYFYSPDLKQVNYMTRAIIPQIIKVVDFSKQEFNFNSKIDILPNNIMKLEQLDKKATNISLYNLETKETFHKHNLDGYITSSKILQDINNDNNIFIMAGTKKRFNNFSKEENKYEEYWKYYASIVKVSK